MQEKLRGLGGEIVFPTMETIEQIKEKLFKIIQDGEYTAGEKIVPKEYEKLILILSGPGGAQRPRWPNSQLPIRNLLSNDAQTW